MVGEATAKKLVKRMVNALGFSPDGPDGEEKRRQMGDLLRQCCSCDDHAAGVVDRICRTEANWPAERLVREIAELVPVPGERAPEWLYFRDKDGRYCAMRL